MTCFRSRVLLARGAFAAAGMLLLSGTAQAELPPTGGKCSVSPAVGHAESTEFTIACSDWVDPEQSQLLTYRFLALVPGSSPVVLAAFGQEATVTTVLPEGSDPSGELRLYAFVRDEAGDTAVVEMSANVVGANQDRVAGFANGIATAVARELESGNPALVLEYAGGLGGEDEEEAGLIEDQIREGLDAQAIELKAQFKGLRASRQILRRIRRKGVVEGEKCSFWDPDELRWDSKGCKYQQVETHTTCLCNHL